MPPAARTIGRVLEMIRSEFPDISVSKLRYLETEGLISPDRQQPSGYRRFSQEDIDRLLYVLRAQRDRYLPLKVIREELEALDRGETPASLEPDEPPAPAEPRPAPVRATSPRSLTRRQLLEQSGLGERSFVQLERMKIIQPIEGKQFYSPDALVVATAAKRLSSYGIDLRQLRVVQQAATMEAAIVEQALAPYRRRAGQPEQVVSELFHIMMQAHGGLLAGQIR